MFLEGNAHQLSFVVEQPHPFDGVRDFYVDRLPHRWRICSSDGIGWHSFIDGTQTPEVFVHQRLVHWVDYGRNRLLLLGLRYESELNGSTIPIEPDSRQLVVLAEYKEEDVEGEITRLEISCSPHD